MINVSDPQALYEVDPLIVHKYVAVLRGRGFDVHEFATEFVNRTAQLGYPPNLEMATQEFMAERCVA